MKTPLGVKKVCVVDDSTDAGKGQAAAIADTLGPIADLRRATISDQEGRQGLRRR